MARKIKLPPAKRRLRHVWTINPKTRVKPSEKGYQRSKEKKEARLELADDEM